MSYNLELLAGSVFIACFLALALEFKLKAALLLATIKILISYFYFALLYDGNYIWNLKDDLGYAASARYLLSKDLNPISLLFSDLGRNHLFSIAGGHHVLFEIINFFTFYIFDAKYYSPVFFNVAITCMSSIVFMRTLRLIGYSERVIYQIGFLSVIGFESLAWTSFLNLKEPIIIFMSILTLYNCIKLHQNGRAKEILIISVLAWLFYYLRFYIPVLILVAYCISIFKIKNSSLLYLLVGCLIFTGASGLEIDRLYKFYFDDFFISTIRFIASPRPWAIENEYNFLTISSVIHILLLPFALMGLCNLNKRGFGGRFLANYLIILVVFYSLLPEFNGPRHRHQLYLIFILIQMMGLMHFLKMFSSNWRTTFTRKMQFKPSNSNP